MSTNLSEEKTRRIVRDFFPRVEVPITRWHRFKVRGRKCKGDVRGRFSMQSVVDGWNVLPEDVME